MNRRTKQTNLGKGEPEVPKPQPSQEEAFSLYKLLEVDKKALIEEIVPAITNSESQLQENRITHSS